MKKFVFTSIIVCISLVINAQTYPKSYMDSVSYSLGMDIAKNLQQGGLDTLISAEMIAQGLRDGLLQENYKISVEQSQRIVQIFLYQMQQEQQKKQYGKNIDEGKAFLEENKKNKDVKITSSGLQYKIIEKGNGVKPATTDKVTINYKGTLINGTVFDSSYERGQPATFGVTQVIPGFSEALQMMSPGAHYIVYIPQELAYGERAAGKIEPYSTLVFEIEMISIPTQETQTESTQTEDVKKTGKK